MSYCSMQSIVLTEEGNIMEQTERRNYLFKKLLDIRQTVRLLRSTP